MAEVNIQISVIVSIYKNLEGLELILLALAEQTVKSFEVIISEDNNSEQTALYIAQARKRFPFLLKHISQEDKGFRKNMALNKSVAAAETDYLIFLDGDCVPHKKFVESYQKYLSADTICVGRRCMVGKKPTDKLYQTKNLKLLSVFNILAYTKRWGRAFYVPPFLLKPYPFRRDHSAIVGCNWGIHKQNILDVNGYDEDYVLAAVGEDTDMEWRLRTLRTFNFLNLKRQAIVYHLDHPLNYTIEANKKGTEKMNKKIKEGAFFCKNGINKYISE
ncbi:MAG: glycosyltransferase [Tannerellaceae bacterium]|nr:glycosyltransferase [Tannerellaceae bacterium]